jgi:GTP-binding nuclear protein Ran
MRMINNSYNIETLKVLLVGDHNVGKSSYINRCVTGDFNNRKNGQSINNMIINTNKGDFCLNIYKISEQKHITELKNIKIDAVIYMFDTTNEKSLNSIDKWIEEVNKYDGSLPSILVGNKFDIVNIKNTEKLYKNIIKIIRKHNILYYNISAKTNYNFEKPYLNILRSLTNDEELNLN